ncbi:hypothetical protein FIBSPDRAFT_883161 [Athelia psychrophila]|uniref:DUF6534 domain-containing protein n=1 Tax=Athelia psychrophila TaxID=1759441 RepID=A0A166UMC4_9AGAM|nr:hypothetical protein FIBSPDRAFT_883161 [Fibularhizoctonia sp. CBS 109695]
MFLVRRVVEIERNCCSGGGVVARREKVRLSNIAFGQVIGSPARRAYSKPNSAPRHTCNACISPFPLPNAVERRAFVSRKTLSQLLRNETMSSLLTKHVGCSGRLTHHFSVYGRDYTSAGCVVVQVEIPKLTDGICWQSQGALSIGGMISMVGYGITLMQVCSYFTTYLMDSTSIKLLVWMAFALDTLHSALGEALVSLIIRDSPNKDIACHVNYRFTALLMWRNIKVDRSSSEHINLWSLIAAPILSVALSLIVKCFFLARAYRLLLRWRNWRMHIVVVAFSLSTVGFVCGLFLTLVSDVVVAFAVMFSLHQYRSDNDEANSLIARILVFTTKRFLLITYALQFIFLHEWANAFMPYPISYYGLAVDFIYCKVLVYALMETLNSRYAIRGPAVDRSTDDTSLELTTRSISPTQHSVSDGSIADI